MLSLKSTSLDSPRNQLEFRLKVSELSRDRERKREREWEREKLSHDKGPKWKSKHVACRSKPAINQNGPKKRNQQQQRGNQKKEKQVFDLTERVQQRVCGWLHAPLHQNVAPHTKTETETEPDPSNRLYCIYIVYICWEICTTIRIKFA